jgi:hypothetical protein
MAHVDQSKPGAAMSEGTPSNRFGLFAITFGVVFSIFYLFVMNYGWQLFTYYPKVGQLTFLNHPPSGPSPGGPMKWYGYVATSGVVAFVVGLLICVIPEKVLAKFWWAGLIWLVPILATVVLLYLIIVVGD